tara:strand:- start:299 stop:1198 length:900 start_codon:yes stop_codon:yes gene_type:complete
MKLFSKRYFLIFLKGMSMGAADIIPGVSGGTIALISGIYEELITTISNFNFSKFSILKKQNFNFFWKEINGNFILSLFLGIILSIILLSNTILYIIKEFPIQIWSFFFGLIFSSIFYLIKEIKPIKILNVFFVFSGITISYFLTTITPSTENISLIYLFFASIAAIIAMILPGISGAFILILFGVYEVVLKTINDFINMLITLSFQNFDILFSKLFTITLGIFFGLISFSKIIKWMFNHYKKNILSFLIGMMIGSLPEIWPLKKNYISFENIIIYVSIFMMIGFLVLIVLEKFSKKNKR